MAYCSVPGCSSGANDFLLGKVCFYRLPSQNTDEINPLKKQRTKEWLRNIKAENLPENELEEVRTCSRHFWSGSPACDTSVTDIDWIPTRNLPFSSTVQDENHNALINRIIVRLPEITEKFDVPDLILLGTNYNVRKIESDLVDKYITNPICDENGAYINDHDYLGLPIIRQKTGNPIDNLHDDHSYSINERPACFYIDLKHFCNICQQNNANLFDFNSHMMIHTVKNEVYCFICDQTFLTTTCLNKHLVSHSALCEICGLKVPSVQLKEHQNTNKSQKRKMAGEYRIADKERVNLCVFCFEVFKKRKPFLVHVAGHTKNINKTELKD